MVRLSNDPLCLPQLIRKMKPITAQLKFLANLDGPLVYIPSKGGGDETEHVGNYVMRDVPILDGRRITEPLDIDVQGFQLVQQATQVSDFYDDHEVGSIYHDEVTALLVESLGATRVEIFDDTRRSSSQETQSARNIRETASIVHNDYTARSGVRRLKDYFSERPDEANELLQKRFAIVNVWRSIAGTIRNHPLAMCDASSMKPEHLVSVERRAEDRIGELQVALYDAEQSWYYFPDMRMDEALIFKTFDTEDDGRTRFTVHTSFEIPGVDESVPSRESLETRCIVFFD
jgi:hypothetical protein